VTATRAQSNGFFSGLRISLTATRLSRRGWDHDIEDLALLVDISLQIHAPAGDPHDYLVQVAAIARTSPLPQTSREMPPAVEHSVPHRFVGQVEPAFGKEVLVESAD